MFIRPREPYTFSPLHGFRVPGFTFWQGRVSSWVSGFGFRNKCGLQVGFRVSESAGYKLRCFGSTYNTRCALFDLSPTSAK